jgi:phosphoenolpyruvate synthase/pyruvate phosphate dikinase
VRRDGRVEEGVAMSPERAPRLVVGLGEDSAADARAVGRKPATLARLRSAGFPVPGGFVLTVEGVGRIPPSGGPVPADVCAALAAALEAKQAGAIVTDGGGVLAHADVIAREYAIPAVLATGNATRRLCDGDIVTLDGTAGLVQVH